MDDEVSKKFGGKKKRGNRRGGGFDSDSEDGSTSGSSSGSSADDLSRISQLPLIELLQTILSRELTLIENKRKPVLYENFGFV